VGDVRIDLSESCFVEMEDGYNYVLKQRHTVTGDGPRAAKAENVGKVVERTVGYFNSIEHATEKVVLLELAGPGDLDAVKAVIRGIHKTLALAREVTECHRSQELNKVPELLEKPTKKNVEEAYHIVRRSLG
jgi:hypothetical protein